MGEYREVKGTVDMIEASRTKLVYQFTDFRMYEPLRPPAFIQSQRAKNPVFFNYCNITRTVYAGSPFDLQAWAAAVLSLS